MPALLIALFAALRRPVRSRLEIQAEVLALRHRRLTASRRGPSWYVHIGRQSSQT
jgi:hypothetical protein